VTQRVTTLATSDDTFVPHQGSVPTEERRVLLDYRLLKVEEGVTTLISKFDQLFENVVTKEYYQLVSKPYIERFIQIEQTVKEHNPADIRDDLNALEARLSRIWWTLITMLLLPVIVGISIALVAR